MRLLVPRGLRTPPLGLHPKDEKETLHKPVHLVHVTEPPPLRLPDVLRRLLVLAGLPNRLLGLLPRVLLLALRLPLVERLPLPQAVAAHVMPRLRLLLRPLPADVAMDAPAVALQQRLAEPLLELGQQVVVRLVLVLLLLPLPLEPQRRAEPPLEFVNLAAVALPLEVVPSLPPDGEDSPPPAWPLLQQPLPLLRVPKVRPEPPVPHLRAPKVKVRLVRVAPGEQ